MKKEKIKEQMEIVNGDSREAIVDLIDSNPSLCSKAQVAIIELKDNKLTEKLMSSQRVIRDEAIIKIFMMDDIMPVKLLGRARRRINERVHQQLCSMCDKYFEKYEEYDRQRHCEDIVEALSRVDIVEYSESLAAIYGEGNTGYSIREF